MPTNTTATTTTVWKKKINKDTVNDISNAKDLNENSNNNNRSNGNYNNNNSRGDNNNSSSNRHKNNDKDDKVTEQQVTAIA